MWDSLKKVFIVVQIPSPASNTTESSAMLNSSFLPKQGWTMPLHKARGWNRMLSYYMLSGHFSCSMLSVRTCDSDITHSFDAITQVWNLPTRLKQNEPLLYCRDGNSATYAALWLARPPNLAAFISSSSSMPQCWCPDSK